MSNVNLLSPLITPLNSKAYPPVKSSEEIGTEFASIFFKQVIHQMLNTIHKTNEKQENLWDHFQAEILAEQFASTEAARPIREAVTQDMIRLQGL